ncbi:hypothetical protein XA68_11754 [Ophiocordyceps unilateralis]|uniref:Reverse transcriptase domain-containing protein n=1 Tax=Ophiocordyceps unilateralis TaxID=268505 RepID=A0A2A9PG21_OPHUN|nr:hypothetical protein XA68_11754 [Ophiocordyceps unilateralis]
MPLQQDMIHKLAGKAFISAVDAKSFFHQFLVHEDDKEKFTVIRASCQEGVQCRHRVAGEERALTGAATTRSVHQDGESDPVNRALGRLGLGPRPPRGRGRRGYGPQTCHNRHQHASQRSRAGGTTTSSRGRLAGKRVRACCLPSVSTGTKCIACRNSKQPCEPVTNTPRNRVEHTSRTNPQAAEPPGDVAASPPRKRGETGGRRPDGVLEGPRAFTRRQDAQFTKKIASLVQSAELQGVWSSVLSLIEAEVGATSEAPRSWCTTPPPA